MRENGSDTVAAVSVGVVAGEGRLDPEYRKDRDAEVDFNVVMTGTGKEATVSRKQLDALVDRAADGIAAQQAALARAWVW